MKSKIEIVRAYFQSWIDRDKSCIEAHFDQDIIYTECYGPVYTGKDQVLRWFNDWNEKGRVIAWDIRTIYECDATVIAEWNFKCEYEGETSDFDGVSILHFTVDNAIDSIREYESKSDHTFPYGKETR